MHHLRGRPRGTLVRRGVAAVLVASVSLAAAGCTGDDEPSSPAYSRGATSTLEPRPAAPEVRVTRVAGRLSRQDREALADRVGTVVAAYYEDAYLGGEQPRTSFRDAFATFTPDAARRARRDERLTTNAALGPTTESVVPRRQRAFLSVLAPRGRAAGVSARVDLVYLVRRAEEPDRVVTVEGRLLLTRVSSGGWKIFGYDISRGEQAAGEGS